MINETNCTIEHNGQTFESGGAYILPCKDGKLRGVIYVSNDQRTVTTWHGEFIAKVDTVSRYRGNFCKMTRITFTYEGRKMIGEYCADWADACKVRSTK